MIPEELLSMLVCPETHMKLTAADASLLEQLNAAVVAGRLTNRGGEKISKPFTAALVRADRQIVYPIIDQIPMMLVEAGIPLAQLSAA